MKFSVFTAKKISVCCNEKFSYCFTRATVTDCTGPDGSVCYHGFRCCGHGVESCMCESPKMIDTMGQCKGEFKLTHM